MTSMKVGYWLFHSALHFLRWPSLVSATAESNCDKCFRKKERLIHEICHSESFAELDPQRSLVTACHLPDLDLIETWVNFETIVYNKLLNGDVTWHADENNLCMTSLEYVQLDISRVTLPTGFNWKDIVYAIETNIRLIL